MNLGSALEERVTEEDDLRIMSLTSGVNRQMDIFYNKVRILGLSTYYSHGES